MNAPHWSAAQWRKSTRSTDTGGACVEVADIAWRKSSHSDEHGEQCVEVAAVAYVIAVRDSKDPDGPKLALSPSAWSVFTAEVKGAVHDLA